MQLGKIGRARVWCTVILAGLRAYPHFSLPTTSIVCDYAGGLVCSLPLLLSQPFLRVLARLRPRRVALGLLIALL